MVIKWSQVLEDSIVGHEKDIILRVEFRKRFRFKKDITQKKNKLGRYMESRT